MEQFLGVTFTYSYDADSDTVSQPGGFTYMDGPDTVTRNAPIIHERVPGVAGRWHRLNPAPNESGGVAPEHETLTCNGSTSVVWCRYNKQPEPGLGYVTPPQGTRGTFTGTLVDASACFGLMVGPCSTASVIAEGTMHFRVPGGADFDVDQTIAVQGDGSMVLSWDTGPGAQFHCPWFRSFAAALAANPTAIADCAF